MGKKAQKGTSKLSPNGLLFNIIAAIIVTFIILVAAALFLRFFTRHGKEVEMPSYIGKNAQELTQSGKSEGFIFDIVDSMYEKGAKPGSVLKQNPLPGEKVKHGRKVYITKAAINPPTISMPELHDLSLDQAKRILDGQKLLLERTIEKPSPYENIVLDVLYESKSIKTGTPIRQGEKLTLVVGKNIGDLPDSLQTDNVENF